MCLSAGHLGVEVGIECLRKQYASQGPHAVVFLFPSELKLLLLFLKLF